VTKFGVCFLMVFGQLAFGGTLALAIPPFFKVERGFYKSTGVVYLGAGLTSAIGLAFLAHRGDRPGSPAAASLWALSALWALFCVVLALYLFTLWTDNGLVRARAYTFALALGLVAVLDNALTLRPAAFGIIGSMAYGMSALSSSMVLGFASGAMMFGHWYLIDPNLPVDYLRSLVRVLGVALVGDLVVLGLAMAALALFGGVGASAVRDLASSDLALLIFRLLVGPAASLVLAWMCWETLKIPQTMAATGLLYITVMSVLVGELLGRFILFRTSVPL